MSLGSDELAKRFGYHRATRDSAPQHNSIRQIMLDTAHRLDEILPPGRDSSLAFTHLQEAMHWANSAIAMEDPIDTDQPHLPNKPWPDDDWPKVVVRDV